MPISHLNSTGFRCVKLNGFERLEPSKPREERSSAADLITRSPSSRVKPAFWIMTSVESKRSGPTSASKIDLYLASTIDSSTDEEAREEKYVQDLGLRKYHY